MPKNNLTEPARSSPSTTANQPVSSDPTNPPSAGKGMPAKSPRPQGPLTEHQTTPHDSAVEASAQLPHERDQSTDMTAATPDPAVQQAAKDVKRGLSDTSKGAELDQAYQKQKHR